MAAFINIRVQDVVFFAARRSSYDDETIPQLTSILEGVPRDATFDALYTRLAPKWHLQDDVVHPFHDDRRSLVDTVWTFDLERDILRFDKAQQTLCLPLDALREGSATVSSFTPYTQPVMPPQLLETIARRPHVGMRRSNIDLERQLALTARILADFAHQWRHVLRAPHNAFTFRRLACAFIRIATLDFDVLEIDEPRRGAGGHLVALRNLPDWQPFTAHIVRRGGVSAVICRQPRHALALLRADYAEEQNAAAAARASRSSSSSSSPGGARTYLVFTGTEIMIHRVSAEGEESCTLPERLFDDDDDGGFRLSETAVRCLVEATTHPRNPGNRLQDLPVELQDLILDHVSAGPIERARVGCLLNIGQPFTWRLSGGRAVEREEGRRNRTRESPVESHVRFDGVASGVAYR